MNFIMPGQVAGALTDHRQVISALDFKHLVLRPLAVLPGPHTTSELAEVDFRVKVGSKVAPMIAAIDVNNVDGINAVKIVACSQCRIGIDHTRIKANP